MDKDEPKLESSSDPSQERKDVSVKDYESRLTEMADLVAHVRHEINNPLTGVIGQAQLLLREDLSDAARRRVETIEQLATRIKETVAQLRAVQRPQPSADLNIKSGEGDGPPRH